MQDPGGAADEAPGAGVSGVEMSNRYETGLD